MRTPNFLAAAVLLASACGSTTPTEDGASLMQVTFSAKQGGPPAGLAAAPTRHEHTLVVNPNKRGEVKVVLEVVKDPASGGQYLHSVEVVALHSGGGAMTAALLGGAMPSNMGSVEAPIASLPIMVEWHEDRGCGGSLMGQTSIILKGDGTAVRQ